MILSGLGIQQTYLVPVKGSGSQVSFRAALMVHNKREIAALMEGYVMWPWVLQGACRFQERQTAISTIWIQGSEFSVLRFGVKSVHIQTIDVGILMPLTDNLIPY